MNAEDRFSKIVHDLATELESVEKENAELKRKLTIANYPKLQATNCGSCGEYKHTPWKDDELGFMCVTCLLSRYGASCGHVVDEDESGGES